MRKPSLEITVGVALFAISGILFAIAPFRVITALQENIALVIKILLLALVVVGISVAIHYLIPPEFAARHLQKNKIEYLFYATFLGILTPGPVYAVYPILLTLKRKGIHNSILVSYITGQTIIGPARIPLEAGLLGTKFLLYRLFLAVILGPLAGILYSLLSRKFPDKKIYGNGLLKKTE